MPAVALSRVAEPGPGGEDLASEIWQRLEALQAAPASKTRESVVQAMASLREHGWQTRPELLSPAHARRPADPALVCG